MMDIADCHGLTDLFVASLQEIEEKAVLRPGGYATAIGVCEGCPATRRQSCAAEGVKFKDRHMVRAGKRLWLTDERAQLLAISKGSEL